MLLAAGEPGRRAALPSTSIMIRQPMQRFTQMQVSGGAGWAGGSGWVGRGRADGWGHAWEEAQVGGGVRMGWHPNRQLCWAVCCTRRGRNRAVNTARQVSALSPLPGLHLLPTLLQATDVDSYPHQLRFPLVRRRHPTLTSTARNCARPTQRWCACCPGTPGTARRRLRPTSRGPSTSTPTKQVGGAGRGCRRSGIVGGRGRWWGRAGARPRVACYAQAGARLWVAVPSSRCCVVHSPDAAPLPPPTPRCSGKGRSTPLAHPAPPPPPALLLHLPTIPHLAPPPCFPLCSGVWNHRPRAGARGGGRQARGARGADARVSAARAPGVAAAFRFAPARLSAPARLLRTAAARRGVAWREAMPVLDCQCTCVCCCPLFPSRSPLPSPSSLPLLGAAPRLSLPLLPPP